jgi:hypothetical protein
VIGYGVFGGRTLKVIFLPIVEIHKYIALLKINPIEMIIGNSSTREHHKDVFRLDFFIFPKLAHPTKKFWLGERALLLRG